MICMFRVLHCYQQMYLKILETKCIEIYELDPAHFLSALELTWQACLELLADVDMLLMTEKSFRERICHVIHRYAIAHNKYIKNQDKNKGSLYIQYLDPYNLYGWVMSQKLPVDCFKWTKNMLKFNKDSIKNYDKDTDKGYILEVDVKYPKRLHNFYFDLTFLPERMTINK